MKKTNHINYNIGFIIALFFCITAGTSASFAKKRNFDIEGRQAACFCSTGDTMNPAVLKIFS